jgi:hypothetical protein
MLECVVKKPLAALALAAAATIATLAVPAGASTTTTWSHKTLRCAGGRHATVTYKWQGGTVVDSWAVNGCGHQYLNLTWCQVAGDSPKCGQLDVWPRTKMHVGFGAPEVMAGLELSPSCDRLDICEA